jgi:hypothetical protein
MPMAVAAATIAAIIGLLSTYLCKRYTCRWLGFGYIFAWVATTTAAVLAARVGTWQGYAVLTASVIAGGIMLIPGINRLTATGRGRILYLRPRGSSDWVPDHA